MSDRHTYILLMLFTLCAVAFSGCTTAPEPAPAPPPVIIAAPAPPPVIVQPPPPPPPPPAPVIESYGTILAGVLDLPRFPETESRLGCRKVHKGLTISGGFLFFTCERLREGEPIERQVQIATAYEEALIARGWERRYNAKKKLDEFLKRNANNCLTTVSIRPWTDRTMNEPRGKQRSDFRQIVFQTNFAKGPECEPTYQAFRKGDLLSN